MKLSHPTIGTALYVALLVIAAAVLSGCGSFGHTLLEVKQSAKGCELTAQDGKEFQRRNIAFDGKACTLIVEEGASKAFTGQAIGAKTLTVLPVTELDSLLGAKP
ncbi:MAG: hypothetical protein HYZ17_16465 [Betaproteobacteria bacterium]|nr:hypothetical protein [Betaproteobacteria bacterium]